MLNTSDTRIKDRFKPYRKARPLLQIWQHPCKLYLTPVIIGQPKERGYRWSGDAGGIGGSCSQLVPFQLPLSGDTGSFPKSGDTGGFWSSKCLVPTVSGDMGGIWYLKSQFHGLSGALGGICNLGNGCQELSGDVGGICDLGSRIQDLSGDRGWNIRPVENKWKSSFYPWSTRIPATLVLWYK